MTVKYQTEPEVFNRAVNHFLQGAMVYVVDVFNSGLCFIIIKQAVINVFAFGRNAVQQSQSHPAAFVAGHDVPFGIVVKHARIDFDGVAVNVDKGASDVQSHHRDAAVGSVRDQFVDKRIFVGAQFFKTDTDVVQKFRRKKTAAVRNGQNQRIALILCVIFADDIRFGIIDLKVQMFFAHIFSSFGLYMHSK